LKEGEADESPAFWEKAGVLKTQSGSHAKQFPKGDRPFLTAVGNESQPIQTARECLEVHSTENVSLETLAAIAI
jgi:hypothetical protein